MQSLGASLFGFGGSSLLGPLLRQRALTHSSSEGLGSTRGTGCKNAWSLGGLSLKVWLSLVQRYLVAKQGFSEFSCLNSDCGSSTSKACASAGCPRVSVARMPPEGLLECRLTCLVVEISVLSCP